jgi:hypothetical protein
MIIIWGFIAFFAPIQMVMIVMGMAFEQNLIIFYLFEN